MKRYMSVKELASELEYTERAIRQAIKSGSIPVVRIPHKNIRIPRKFLAELLEKYPDTKTYSQAKEDERFNIELESRQAKAIEAKTGITPNENILNNEVVEAMAKKKNESGNTEIITNKPKTKKFIPNPKKRLKSVKAEIDNNPDYEPDIEPDDIPDDSRNPDSENEDILSGYKGIGNWD